MTDNQHAHVQLLAEEFIHKNKDENPYTRGARVWEWWYNKHGRSSLKPIPKEMLPTEEDYLKWDCEEAKWIASHLNSYATLLAFWAWTKREPVKEVIAAVIAETRPCGCVEAQCNLFCPYYRTEECK